MNYAKILFVSVMITPFFLKGMCITTQIEKLIENHQSVKSTNILIDQIKEMLHDPTLSSANSLAIKKELVGTLCRLTKYRQSTTIAADRDIRTDVSLVRFIDSTYEISQITSYFNIDRHEIKIIRYKDPSPWHNLALEEVIHTFINLKAQNITE